MARAEIGAATPDDPVRLLHVDEERLRLAAVTLRRGGRFVIVVAERRLWPAALQSLCELLPEHRFVEHAPTSSDEANQAISDPLRDEPGLTIVIRITTRDAGPLETLNLRRESLVKAPANFLVVLDGDEGHARFLREAPDCYSYRDLLVTLEGEHAFEVPTSGEDWDRYLESALAAAREVADPVDRAHLLYGRATRAFRSNQLRVARTLADAGIDALAPQERATLNEDERLLLARLYFWSVDDCTWGERYHRLRRARAVLAPVAERHLDQFTEIESCMVDAIGTDLEAALDAVRRASEHPGSNVGRPLMRLAKAYRERNNVVRARQVLDEIRGAEAAILARDVEWLGLQFLLLIDEGAWTRASQLVSSTKATELSEPMLREWLGRLEANLLRRQGEGRAAQQICDRLPPSLEQQLALIRLTADRGHTDDARAQLEAILQRPWTASGRKIDELLGIHDVLVDVVQQQIAAGDVSHEALQALDSRLAALYAHIELEANPDPPWYRIWCLLRQSEVYLRRRGAEPLALRFAEQAWTLAETHASILAPTAARWCVVAALRVGDLAHAAARLSRGLQLAAEHELRGDQVHLRGLAMWHAALAYGHTAAAEVDLQAAFAASGSRLIEASVLARVGAALDRHDLLRRAQQIYRSLPWPRREGACLEALGETQIAEARYRTYGLATRLTILARRAEPSPITATDADNDGW